MACTARFPALAALAALGALGACGDPGSDPAASSPGSGGGSGLPRAAVDDTPGLQARLDAEGLVVLEPGRTYRIRACLRISRDGGGLIGDGTPVLVLGTADGEFDNPDRQVCATYAGNAVGLYARDLRDVVLKGFSVRKEPREGTYVKAIGIRACENVLVEGLDVSGFGLGGGIVSLDSVRGGILRGNTIRDGHSDHELRGQITGIAVDDNRCLGNSSGLTIEGNVIRNLTVGPRFFALHGWETDGITIAHPDSGGHLIRNNTIENVGEGIDLFGTGMQVVANDIRNCVLFGIKLIHGADSNEVSGNAIDGAGLAGIVLSGSSGWDVGHTTGNTVDDNRIAGVNADAAVREILETRWPEWVQSRTAGILLVGGDPWTALDNDVANNVLVGDGCTHYGIYDETGGLNTIGQNPADGWVVSEHGTME